MKIHYKENRYTVHSILLHTHPFLHFLGTKIDLMVWLCSAGLPPFLVAMFTLLQKGLAGTWKRYRNLINDRHLLTIALQLV